MSQRSENSIHREFEREGPRAAGGEMPGDPGRWRAKGEAAANGLGERFEEKASGDPEAWFGGGAGDHEFENEPAEEAVGHRSEQFAEEADTNTYDALEEAIARALDEQGSGEFFNQLFVRLRRAAKSLRPAVSGSAKAKTDEQDKAGTAGDETSVAGSVENALRQILPILREYSVYHCDEAEALEDMTDRFATEDLDAALSVLGGIAARTLLLPLMRRAAARLPLSTACELVRGATQAARILIQRGGTQAVQALPHVVGISIRTAFRQRLPVKALPKVLHRIAGHVASQPNFVRHFASPTESINEGPVHSHVIRLDSRQGLQISGPVEITIVRLKDSH